MKYPIFCGLALVTLGLALPEAHAVRVSSETIKRRDSALSMGQSQDASEAGPKLLRALSDKDAMTRSMAAQSLGSLQYAASREKLSEVLASDSNADVREAAAVALRQIGTPEAVDALGKALKDTAVNVRLAALMGLEHYGDAKSRPYVEAACQDPEAGVRRTAVYVLGRLGDPAAAPAVRELLKDPDASLRASAARTLGELRSADSAEALKTLLKDSDKRVQAAAARALLMLKDSAGLETAKMLAGDPDLTIRLVAIDALGWSKDPAAEAHLQGLLAQAPADSRVAIQESLARTKKLRKRS